MKLYAVLFAWLCLTGIGKEAWAGRADTTINYVESHEDILNPERGFYRQQNIFASNYVPLDKKTLISYRTDQKVGKAQYSVRSSLLYVEYVLDTFTHAVISEVFLNNFNTDCATARSAGVKLIVRFCYVNKSHGGNCADGICPPYGDAPKAVVLNHIQQLKPYLQQNADIIACMQMGFIGIWGENYYSDYFGDASKSGNGRVLDTNWRDRVEVLKALLTALPKSRMIQVRVPQLKQRYLYGVNASVDSPPLNDRESFSGTDKARIGFHNDCFAGEKPVLSRHAGDRTVGTAVDELVDIFVAGLVEVADRTVPDDPALPQHRDVVGDLAGAGHVMRDRQRSRAEALDRLDDQFVDDVGHDRVEAGRRLVEEDDFRVGGDGAGKAHPLLHPA